MAVRRHLRFYQIGNSTIRSADPKNHSLERNMEWISETDAPFARYPCVAWGHSRSSKAAPFYRAHMTLYSSSIVSMPLSITVSELEPHTNIHDILTIFHVTELLSNISSTNIVH